MGDGPSVHGWRGNYLCAEAASPFLVDARQWGVCFCCVVVAVVVIAQSRRRRSSLCKSSLTVLLLILLPSFASHASPLRRTFLMLTVSIQRWRWLDDAHIHAGKGPGLERRDANDPISGSSSSS